MDWQNPGKEKVILAVIKYPAKNKTNNISPLFINPGVRVLRAVIGCGIH